MFLELSLVCDGGVYEECEVWGRWVGVEYV